MNILLRFPDTVLSPTKPLMDGPEVLFNTSQHLTIHTHTHTHTHLHTNSRWQPAYQELLHTHSHTNRPATVGNLGFSFLPKNIKTCWLTNTRIQLQTNEETFRLVCLELREQTAWIRVCFTEKYYWEILSCKTECDWTLLTTRLCISQSLWSSWCQTANTSVTSVLCLN